MEENVTQKFDPDAYENLLVAIVESAVEDYIYGLQNPHTQKGSKYIKECERFFRSELFQLYTVNMEIDGEAAIRAIKARALKPSFSCE